jgi:glycosyltransferase involved in cell wall biosynthesis
MKIGFLSMDHLRDWTGITRLIDRIAAEMARRGHEVFLLAHENKAATQTKKNVPVGQCDYLHTLVTFSLDNPANILSAREKIAECGLDVCMTSMGNTDLLYMPRLFHGSRTPYIIGEAADPRVFIYERWQPYEHFAALNGAAAIQILLKEYRPFYPDALKPRITTIGNPAPPKAEVDFAARRSKEIRHIVAVGRFNEADKRFSVLLRAFALLCRDFPEWHLKLVGDGHYWEYYHEMAKQLGIKQLVNFTGAVPDPAEHYNQADIFCLPSFKAEGLPMVYVEASAHALPLIGFESCVASNALITPDTGALAKNGIDAVHGTPEQLVGALRSLMERTPEQREEIGRNTQRIFQERFNEKLIFDSWEKLFMDVLEKWKGFEPDSPIWTPELLNAATEEAASRPMPLVSPEISAADEQTENVRLRCELAKGKIVYTELENKYNALLRQFQAVTMRKKGKR